MRRAQSLTLHREEGSYEVGYLITPGHPGRMYEDRYGNPPIPPDPPEIEIVSVCLDGKIVPYSDELADAIEEAAMERGEE